MKRNLLIVLLFLSCSGLSWLPRFRSKPLNWMKFLGNVLETVEHANTLDLSSGAFEISSPNHVIYKEPYELGLISINGRSANLTKIVPSVTPILRVHKFSRKFLKKFPDSALLGILALSTLELLQRQLAISNNLPLYLKDAANITTENLNVKLEILSSLSWDFDPFVKAELEALQSQPLEVIESFILKDLLPRIDKDISPVLSSMIADPKQVKLITKYINGFVQEMAGELTKSTTTNIYTEPILPIQETALRIVENVDKVGEVFEEAIREWNKAMMELNKLTKKEFAISFIRKTFSLVASNRTTVEGMVSSANASLVLLPAPSTRERPGVS